MRKTNELKMMETSLWIFLVISSVADGILASDRPNIIVILTDDQDVVLNGMVSKKFSNFSEQLAHFTFLSKFFFRFRSSNQ